jgi:hypothetical protein
MNRVLYIATVMALLGIGCSTTPTDTPEPNLVLLVTNQSFDNPLVDITVAIDGNQVVSQDFAVGNQHNFKVLELCLPKGSHTLKADSVTGEASMTKAFELPSKRWILLWYDFNEKRMKEGYINADKAFGLQVQDEPIGIE